MINFLVVGGAGFIGNQVCKSLLSQRRFVTVIDNLISGSREHIFDFLDDDHFTFIKGDITDPEYSSYFNGVDCVVMLAANADIAKATTDPTIDFYEGTLLMQLTLEAMRNFNVPRLIFSSGSGVYGDRGYSSVNEESLMEPISPYGANKLACEALIRSYVYMFGIQATIFRFGNVVGPMQTHGVCYDFIRRLLADPYTLSIMGDGSQDKPYLHVEDVVGAIKFVLEKQRTSLEVFNLAPKDTTTVNEIAAIVSTKMNLDPKIRRGSEGRGWKGDVPIVRLDSSKIEAFGYTLEHNSTSSVKKAVADLLSTPKYLIGR